MRIVGGTRRGLKLADVGDGDRAAHLRPTSDRVRESLFNVLTQGRLGNRVAGAKVLDLFAGTGALGLEALSRGAAHATFVDPGRPARKLLTQNIALCRFGAETQVIPLDATRLGPGTPHDLIFLDPPYDQGLGELAIAAAVAGGWLAPGALVVWEEGAPPVLPPWLCARDSRRYGQTWVTLAEMPDAP